MITIIFYILSAITLSTGLLTILSKNPVNSAVYMIVCFFSLAGHFLVLNAQFLAVVQLIVYTGAVMVLLLFTLMLMNLNESHEPRKKIMSRIAAVIASGLMGILLLAIFLKASPLIESQPAAATTDFQTIKVLGQVLMNDYLIPFEFVSVLLIVAMIGAVLISKKEKKA